jgi:chromosome segregation ATPase
MSGALALAEETARQRVAEHELMARVLAAEKLASEQLRGELMALRRDLEAARGTIESVPPVIQPLNMLHAALTGIRTGRQRRAALAAGLHPDHDLLAEAENARRQAVAVADALRVENAELRAERDDLRARCDDQGAGPVQAVPGALADVELTQVQAELAEAQRDAERLTVLLSRKRELVRGLQETKDAQEIELAAANAEIVQRKTGASGLLSVAIAREQAIQAVREAQARRPPVDVDD